MELFKPATVSASLLVSIKKIIWFGCGFFSWWRHKKGIFEFLTHFNRPGRQSYEPFFGSNFFGNQTISPVYRALDWPPSMSGTKVLAQKPHCTPKSENCRKSIEFPTGGISKSDNSPLEHASELFEPEMSTGRTGSDWIRTETTFCRIRTGSDCYFFENGRIRTGSDWEIFCCFNVIILKISKILVVIRFHRFAKW